MAMPTPRPKAPSPKPILIAVALGMALMSCECGSSAPPVSAQAPKADASVQAPSPEAEAPQKRLNTGSLKDRLEGVTHFQVRSNPMGGGPYTYANQVFSIGDPVDVAAFIKAIGPDQEKAESCPRCMPAMALELSDLEGQRGRLSLFCNQNEGVSLIRGSEESACWFVQDPATLKKILKKAGDDTSGRPEQASGAVVGKDDTQTTAEASNAFGLKLLTALGESNDDNLAFSPYSLSVALAMLQAGAKGDTQAEIKKTLGFPLGSPRLENAFAAITASMGESAKTNGHELAIANSLWGQTSLSFVPEYLQLLTGRFDAKLSTVDFISEREAARTAINTWVSEQTRGNIENLILGSNLSDETRLVLVNALFFKGRWASRFKKASTAKAPFNLTADKAVEVDTMNQTGTFKVASAGGWSLLELPFTGRDASMLILLPEGDKPLSKAQASLTPEVLGALIEALSEVKVKVSLPRFKVSSRVELAKVLTGLGMEKTFTTKADFSGITKDQKLQPSEVIHQTIVMADEEGSEAAAATAVVATRGISIPKTFKADKPFLFAIRAHTSGAFLFVGRVSNPSEGQ